MRFIVQRYTFFGNYSHHRHVFLHFSHFFLGSMIINAYLCTRYYVIMGLTGFDSGPKWYVSMRSLVGYLHKQSGQKFNWRKQVRSRCLIEEQ